MNNTIESEALAKVIADVLATDSYVAAVDWPKGWIEHDLSNPNPALTICNETMKEILSQPICCYRFSSPTEQESL